jgi:hypothetical protein
MAPWEEAKPQPKEPLLGIACTEGSPYKFHLILFDTRDLLTRAIREQILRQRICWGGISKATPCPIHMLPAKTDAANPPLHETRDLPAFYRRKVDIERQPVPQRVCLLPFHPFLAAGRKLHIKVIDQAGQDDPHLRIGKTARVSCCLGHHNNTSLELTFAQYSSSDQR